MKERGKAVETYGGERDVFSDYNYSAPDAPCEKHPSAYPIGVCPHCLKERLIKLVCSDCGEQRLSSCSCSEVSSSSNRNSSATEAASVGRISFLIENERAESKQSKIKATKRSGGETEEFVILKRSNSSCVVGAKRRTNGFWRVVRLFKKKREKSSERIDGGGGGGGDEQKSDLWVFDYMGVSRSRSLCSFRGGGACNSYDPDEGSSEFAFSSAKISDFNGRSSIESSRMSGFSEAEPRKSGIRVLSDSETTTTGGGGGGGGGGVIKRIGGLKESDFTKQMDESSFIDLKLDSLSESKPEFSVPELIRLRNGDFLGNHESLIRGGSCRVKTTLDERSRIGKDKRGHKVWRWIIRHHPNWGISSKKNDHD